MDEEQSVKKALKDKYLREIYETLVKEDKLEQDHTHIDEKGRLIVESPDNLIPAVTYLADKLAEAKAEFWWKTNIQKHDEDKEKSGPRLLAKSNNEP